LTSLVVDASVAVKWCLPLSDEGLVPQAQELLDRYGNSSIGFLVPDLFWVEVASTIWKAVRKKRIPRGLADAALTLVQDLDIPTVSSGKMMHQAMQLAITHNRSVYDCLYVALAVQQKTEMITADEKLANALAAYLPVKWLGAY